MIEIPIDSNYMNRAREKASTVGILQGSITGGTSNVVGAIGEIIVADSIKAEQMNTYDYDLVKDGMLYIAGYSHKETLAMRKA